MSDSIMPSLGADMEAGILVEWKIAPGTRVKPGDIVAVVETQKGAIDVEIFEDGVVDEGLFLLVGEDQRFADDAGDAPGDAAACPEEELEGGIGEDRLGGAGRLHAVGDEGVEVRTG